MAQERDRWTSRSAFVMAAIGSAVGLGNVWRFPFVAYQNGGGAFLIPYLVALITAGIPLMILEFGLGQRMQGSAPLSFSKINKKWEWIGWWALSVGFIITTYYAVVMAWCWNYLYHSFSLAWKSGAKEFFFNSFLGLTKSPAELGGIRWPIVLGLLLTWGAIAWIVRYGVRGVGRVVMVTVPVPVILLAILVIRGMALPGAIDGIRFYLTPDFNRLLDPRVWLAAYSQIFFSLSLGFGILIAYASCLPERADINNNAFITSFANCGTSYFAGFAVFSVLGYLAQATNVSVKDVVATGPGLAFVTYPTAIALLPALPAMFGAVFFITLLTLGIDSAFSIVEAVVVGLKDKWGMSQQKATMIFSSAAFIVGFLFTTGAGLYWLDIVDHFMNNFGLALVGLAECLIIGYAFGAGEFREYINSISEIKVGRWWEFFIKIVTPAILGISTILVITKEIWKPYEGYPQWALVLGGWVLAGLLIFIGRFVMKAKGSPR